MQQLSDKVNFTQMDLILIMRDINSHLYVILDKLVVTHFVPSILLLVLKLQLKMS